MASKGSNRKGGRRGKSIAAGSGTQGRKPSGPANLHDTARKQTTAIARGTANKPKSKGQAAGSTGPSRKASSNASASAAPKKGGLSRLGAAVKEKIRKVLGKSSFQAAAPKARPSEAEGEQKKPATNPRRVIRQGDVSEAELADMSPSQQSSRGPFDKHRSDDLRDADVRNAHVDNNDKWREEDEYTNRSGDKRIGTHDREYD